MKQHGLGVTACVPWGHQYSCCGHKRGANIMNLIRIAGLASLGFAVLVEPAFAGGTPSGVPGPIAGVGLPALILIGGAYWLGRKFFSRKI
jgi:hypothetical protein